MDNRACNLPIRRFSYHVQLIILLSHSGYGQSVTALLCAKLINGFLCILSFPLIWDELPLGRTARRDSILKCVSPSDSSSFFRCFRATNCLLLISSLSSGFQCACLHFCLVPWKVGTSCRCLGFTLADGTQLDHSSTISRLTGCGSDFWFFRPLLVPARSSLLFQM